MGNDFGLCGGKDGIFFGRGRAAGVPFGHAILGESCDGEGGIYQAVFGGEEVEGVFEEEEVEDGDLADLLDVLVGISWG